MEKITPGKETDEAHSTPFDDYPEEHTELRNPTVHSPRTTVLLRAFSTLALGLAVSTAAVIIFLDCFHLFQPALMNWRLKSALPLIFIGSSYGLLQFTLRRTHAEFLLSLAVSIAFILWGAEQFVRNPGLASFIDDWVMFLFVLDLGIVIRGYLKHSKNENGAGP